MNQVVLTTSEITAFYRIRCASCGAGWPDARSLWYENDELVCDGCLWSWCMAWFDYIARVLA